MDKFLCVAFLVLIVLVCGLTAVGYESSSKDQSTARTTAISARESACDLSHSSSGKKCRSNATLSNRTATSGHKKRNIRRKANHKKTKQSSSVKQVRGITYSLKGIASSQRRATSSNNRQGNSNQEARQGSNSNINPQQAQDKRRTTTQSKAKTNRANAPKLSSKTSSIGDFNAKRTKRNHEKSRRNKTLAKSIDLESEDTTTESVEALAKTEEEANGKTIKGSAKSRPQNLAELRDLKTKNLKRTFYYYKRASKLCEKTKNRIVLPKSEKRHNTLEQCVTAAAKKHKVNATGNICWRRKDGHDCTQVRIHKKCKEYRLKKFYESKEDCEATSSTTATVYYYERASKLCTKANDSTVLPKTEKFHDKFERCVAEAYKKHKVNATGNICWRRKDGHECTQVRSHKKCKEYRREKLYESKDKCQGKTYAKTCFRKDPVTKKCKKEKMNSCEGDSSLFKTKQECEAKDILNKCYVPKVGNDDDVCELKETVRTCSDDDNSDGYYYATKDKCLEETLNKCYKYDIADKKCAKVKSTTGCDEKDLFKKRTDCNQDFKARIVGYKTNATTRSCDEVKIKECFPTEGCYDSLAACEDSLPLNKCFYYDDDKRLCIEKEIKTLCKLHMHGNHYETKEECVDGNYLKVCFVMNIDKGQCEEAHEISCDDSGRYDRKEACEKTDNFTKCYKWNGETKSCDIKISVTGTFCDNSRNLFPSLDQCEGSATQTETNCYKYNPIIENCILVPSNNECDLTREEYGNMEKCLETKKQCYKVDKRTGDCTKVYSDKSFCAGYNSNTIEECERSRHSWTCFKLNSDETACEKISTYADCSWNASPYFREDDCLSNNGLKKCFQLNADKSSCSVTHTKSVDCQEETSLYNDQDICESKRQERICFQFSIYKCLPTKDNFHQCSTRADLFDTEEECLKNHDTYKCYKYSATTGDCDETFEDEACSPHEYTYPTLSDCQNNVPQVQCFEHDGSTPEKCHPTIVDQACDGDFWFETKDECMDYHGYVKCHVADHVKDECFERYLQKGGSCSPKKEEYDDLELCKGRISVKKCYLHNTLSSACEEVRNPVLCKSDSYFDDLQECQRYADLTNSFSTSSNTSGRVVK